MISALLWVQKGIVSETPKKYELDDNEYERITEYNLDQYDDGDVDESGQPMSIFGNIKGLTYYTSNEEDPYITISDEDDESDDLKILATDNVIVAAKTEDEISQLEIYVYEEAEDNLYVHHDIMLSSFPLCLELLDFQLNREEGTNDGNEKGNYVAVGTFNPEIEIWDLDIIDSIEIQNTIPMQSCHYHGINITASSSADSTVKLWDLQSLKCVNSFKHHKDKVQQVEWNFMEPNTLLTASFDKTVAAFDSRTPDNVAYWNIGTDPECIRWDPSTPQYFYVSTETGLVLNFDMRNSGQVAPIFTLHAHDSAVSSLEISPSIQGCLVTGSTDKMVKVWDIKNSKPSMVVSRNLEAGKIFSTKFCPDSPFQLAIAGSKGKVFIWDLSCNAGIRNSFKGRTSFPIKNDGINIDVKKKDEAIYISEID
ncbi:11313_t:CDS:2 [Diversispora eburnea]|uniref:11313_t:CDS:1 n=1 Tax=Diversispora eburnea TaxID=1213867 RepID=A0A9N8Z5J4_9GLOM|nr:11313_t:CDS:2 [Diversispora eburnea]